MVGFISMIMLTTRGHLSMFQLPVKFMEILNKHQIVILEEVDAMIVVK